jgi:hypothetical protein
LQLLRQHLAGGDEHAKGDRQVESASGLREISRGEVDHRAALWALVAKVGEGALDAVDALVDGQFRQGGRAQ